MADKPEDRSLIELRNAVSELADAVAIVREQRTAWQPPLASVALPSEASSWNFTTFEKYINQRFGDLSLQLRERYEAQQTGVTGALTAAEKAVNAALTASEKAVDKAEGAQQLRNEAQNEFRKSLSDLSGLMWTIKEGQATVDAVRRELGITLSSLTNRLNTLENGYSNIQGRMWAVSAMWAIAAMAVSVGVRFIGH
jgi:hypothetical protein